MNIVHSETTPGVNTQSIYSAKVTSSGLYYTFTLDMWFHQNSVGKTFWCHINCCTHYNIWPLIDITNLATDSDNWP